MFLIMACFYALLIPRETKSLCHESKNHPRNCGFARSLQSRFTTQQAHHATQMTTALCCCTGIFGAMLLTMAKAIERNDRPPPTSAGLPSAGCSCSCCRRGWRFGRSSGFAIRGRDLESAARPRRLPVPVISVGNVAVGGTGKTPVVAARSVAELERLGRRPAGTGAGLQSPAQRGRQR